MIKVVLDAQGLAGPPLVILGLEGENIRRLVEEDRPVLVNLKDLGLPDIDVVIIHGETPEVLKNKMRRAGLKVPDISEGQAWVGPAFPEARK